MKAKSYEEMSREEIIDLLLVKDQTIEELRLRIADQKKKREKMRQLQADGIQQAKDCGVRFGRPRKKVTKEFYRFRKAYHEGVLTLQEAAEKSHCSVTTFRKWDKEIEAEDEIS